MTELINPSTIDTVRKGVSRIMHSKITLLDSLGNPLNDRLTNAILTSDLTDVNALANEWGYDPNLFAALLSDASEVSNIIMNSLLYLETLVNEGTRIPKKLESNESNEDYTKLPMEVRNKIATFLYRPGSERQLTNFEEVLTLHSETILRLPNNTKRFDEVAPIMEQSLRKILRYQIERHFEEFYSNEEVMNLWNERGWIEFIEEPSIKAEEHLQDGEVRIFNYNFFIPTHNLPIAIKSILRDVRIYLDETNDLDQIISIAQQVLPHRAKMNRVDYFNKKTVEADRLIVIDRALTGYPLI